MEGCLRVTQQTRFHTIITNLFKPFETIPAAGKDASQKIVQEIHTLQRKLKLILLVRYNENKYINQ